MDQLIRKMKELADKYLRQLQEQIENRIEAMNSDDKSHYLIYRVLGISDEQGDQIDIYQNQGRFLYKYAGSFLEEATIMCIWEAKAKLIRQSNKKGVFCLF